MSADRAAAGPSSPAWAYGLMLAIALTIFLSITYVPGGEDGAAADRFAAMDAAFAAIPSWVKQWMNFQHYVFAGSLLFVVWHEEARVYLVGIFLSHAISYAEIILAPVDRLGLGLVSLNHLVWVPALIFILVRYRTIRSASPFGLWIHLVLIQLSFSLFFDIRDSVLYALAFAA